MVGRSVINKCFYECKVINSRNRSKSQLVWKMTRILSLICWPLAYTSQNLFYILYCLRELTSSSTRFNPCFPLRRAYLLLLCWVSKPIPSISSKQLSCCDPTIYIVIYLIMSFILPCLVQNFIWMNITLKVINDYEEIVMIEHAI